jgi:hypothetical protein
MTRKQARPLTEADVRRRLLFLVDEASQHDPVYDQTVQYALRVVSNFYCIGRGRQLDGCLQVVAVSEPQSARTAAIRRMEGEITQRASRAIEGGMGLDVCSARTVDAGGNCAAPQNLAYDRSNPRRK